MNGDIHHDLETSDDRAFLKVAFSICQFEDKFLHIFQHLKIVCKKWETWTLEDLNIFKYTKFSYESHISVSSSEF